MVFLSSEQLNPIRSGSLVSWILDSNLQQDSGSLVLDSGFQSPGFRIPQAQNSWIPESGFPYMGRVGEFYTIFTFKLSFWTLFDTQLMNLLQNMFYCLFETSDMRILKAQFRYKFTKQRVTVVSFFEVTTSRSRTFVNGFHNVRFGPCGKPMPCSVFQ